jgi:hypothetical protein
LTLIVICGGVMIASAGELNFHVLGVIMQLLGSISEGLRLVLIQILIQRRGIRLSPVSTLYYVSPLCCLCLLVPLSVVEVPRLWSYDVGEQGVPYGHLGVSCFLAVGLNLVILFIVERTSALTLNLGGVLKDTTLIWISHLYFESAVTPLTVVGYACSICGLMFWNRKRMFVQDSSLPSASSIDSVGHTTSSSSSSSTKHADRPLLPLHHHRDDPTLHRTNVMSPNAGKAGGGSSR